MLKIIVAMLFVTDCLYGQPASGNQLPCFTSDGVRVACPQVSFSGILVLPPATTGSIKGQLVAPVATTGEPSYFTISLANYDKQVIPGMAVGVHTAGKTYVVLSFQNPIHLQHPGRIDFGAWEHFAQDGRFGLWGGGGLSAAVNGTSSVAGNGVAFLAALSVRLTNSGWFLCGGVRASVSVSSSNSLSADKFCGIG